MKARCLFVRVAREQRWPTRRHHRSGQAGPARQSALSGWYERRFAHHGARARKVGIVALARKLLIALWRYLDQGAIPAGARLVSWRAKVNREAGKISNCGRAAAVAVD